VKEILANYGGLDILWWETPEDMTPARAEKFIPLLADYPRLITNNRLGGGYSGDSETPEQFIPATGFPGKNWEVCMTMNDTWGYKAADHNWKSTAELIHNLVDIASKGGNFLLNVGPKADGTIPDESIERLRQIGDWMKVNSESIYGTSASTIGKPDWGRCTTGRGKMYLHVFDWPADGKLVVPQTENLKVRSAYALAGKAKVNLSADKNATLDLAGVKRAPIDTVVVLETTN
jgi:alpha-L-fucosidase